MDVNEYPLLCKLTDKDSNRVRYFRLKEIKSLKRSSPNKEYYFIYFDDQKLESYQKIQTKHPLNKINMKKALTITALSAKLNYKQRMIYQEIDTEEENPDLHPFFEKNKETLFTEERNLDEEENSFIDKIVNSYFRKGN